MDGPWAWGDVFGDAASEAVIGQVHVAVKVHDHVNVNVNVDV